MSKRWFGFLKCAHVVDCVSLWLVLAGVSVAGAADELTHLPSIDLEIPSTVRVGDPIAIPVAPDGADVQPPDATQNKGWQIVGQQIVLTEAGKVLIPALIIRDASQQPIRRTNPTEVNVLSSIDPQDPKPKEGYEDLPPVSLDFPWVLAVLVGLLLLLILGGGVYGLQRWSQKRKAYTSAPPQAAAVIKSEDEIVLEKLDWLEREKIYLKGRHKEHAFAISHALKFFFAKRYEFDAEESTTSELIYNLRDRFYLSERDLDLIRKLFQGLDQAKFTDLVPQNADCADWIAVSKTLVGSLRKPRAL